MSKSSNSELFNETNVENIWKQTKKSSTTSFNNSTLSLHIAAYENSVETVSDKFGIKNGEDLEKGKFGSISFTSTFLIQVI